MTRRTAPLPEGAAKLLNEMIERQCQAKGPGFLGCWLSRDHEGPHRDLIQGVTWTTEPSQERKDGR